MHKNKGTINIDLHHNLFSLVSKNSSGGIISSFGKSLMRCPHSIIMRVNAIGNLINRITKEDNGISTVLDHVTQVIADGRFTWA